MKSGFVLVFVATSVALFAHAADSQAKPAKSDAAAIKMEGEGINLWMSSSHPTFGQPEDPTFWVHAERGQLLDEPRIWSLEQTRAVIYRNPEEDLVLVARTGTFDEENKSAQLDGDVRVTSGSMVADLANIQWDNAAGVAHSEALATLDDGVNRLVGRAVALYAQEGRFELGEGSAQIQLAQLQGEKPQDEKKKSPEFESISIPKHSGIVGNLNGGVREIRGPVELNLIGIDPANTMNIKADHVNFEYAAGDEKMPTKILLKGHVSLRRADANFAADEGAIDLNTRKARFDGNVVMTGEQIQGASGQYFELNLDTGDFDFGGDASSIDKLWLVAPKKAEKPADSKP